MGAHPSPPQSPQGAPPPFHPCRNPNVDARTCVHKNTYICIRLGFSIQNEQQAPSEGLFLPR